MGEDRSRRDRAIQWTDRRDERAKRRTGRAAQFLAPVIDPMMAELRCSNRLQMDETTMPVLAPGTGAVRKGWLWVVLCDQRGWGGSDPPIAVFHHSPSRGGAVA